MAQLGLAPQELEGHFEDYWCPTLAEKSARRLMALAEERDAFVIFGHCPEQWPTLKKIPEYYC
jgi:N-acyl homoserine lactone hydrolase